MGKLKENGIEKHNFEMMEVELGTSEAGIVQIRAMNSNIEFKEAAVVIKDANTLLATAKNSESEGGHGH